MIATLGDSAVRPLDSSRAERTRSAIITASRSLYLERGYAGTSINAIAKACGISRAAFYHYFKDKREIFNVLGESAHHDVVTVIAECEAALPRQPADIRAWVGQYFDYMDRHGAFVLASTHSAPEDDAFRMSRNQIVTRASWKLGQAIAGAGSHSPDVVGVAVIGMLDRAWFAVQSQMVAVDREEIIAVVAEMISTLTGR